MLTRNCETKLFQHGDFNVRVSLFDINPRHYLPNAYKSAWIETIRDSIGGGYVNSTNEYSFSVTTDKFFPFVSSRNFKAKGTELAKIIDSNFKEPTSIRISIHDNGITNSKTWIILIP